MSYKTIFRERATKEYVEAIRWYEERSLQAADNFVLTVSQTLNEIENKPVHFRLIYKNYHEAKTKKYPYNIVYFIDNKSHTIIITTLFHQKRNPKSKFK
ncbi:MAG: type II toxin-antitoxin system RelE/ParE family toxin [Ginsengibacter sp.]